MSKIIVRNTSIMITDYTLKQAPKLESNFMTWDPIYHRFDQIGMYYDKDERILYLPRGIDLWYVKKQIGVKTIEHEKNDPYQIIPNILMRSSPRDDKQVEALKFTCGLGDYADNEFLPQLSVNLNTGVGKTYVAIATMAYFKIKTIIITGSNSLLKQWGDKIKEYTNLTSKDIVFISGSPAINRIIKGNSLAPNASVFLCTHGTLRSYADEHGWFMLRQLFRCLGIGIKIFDEAHQNFENMCKIDFATNVYKTYYMTATPARSDFKENRVYMTSFKNIPRIDLFDEDNDPHTDYLAIRYNSRPSPNILSSFHNIYGMDRNKYVEYITRNQYFYMALRVILDMIKGIDGRVLMYIGTNDGILRVYKWLSDNYPEYIGNIGIFTSLVSKDDKIKEREKKIILTTTKSAGAGEDIPNLKVTVLLAEPFKSEVLARQTLGRTRAKNTLYIELVDMGFPALRKYYYYKLPIFNKYASSTSDTTIETYELTIRSERIQKKREALYNYNGRSIINPIYFRDDRFFDYTKEDQEYKKELERKTICPIFFYNTQN